MSMWMRSKRAVGVRKVERGVTVSVLWTSDIEDKNESTCVNQL